MTRFRLLAPFAVIPLLAVPLWADTNKDAKKEVAFGIDVARRGLWQEARFRFEQAALLNPDSAAAFNNLGVTLEQQGEFEKARAAYEKALQLEPKNISIQQNYDLFREADEKRNKKTNANGGRRDGSSSANPGPGGSGGATAKPGPAPSATPSPAPSPSPSPSEEVSR